MPQSCKLYQKLNGSSANSSLVRQKIELSERWAELEELLASLRSDHGEAQVRESFLNIIAGRIQSCGRDYLSAIHSLSSTEAQTGSRWLQGIVDQVVARSLTLLPTFTNQ
jgi:hypothetical protein